jgi:hypothetical protein
MKISQCCNAPIKKDTGGVGIFSLTTGSLICSKCKKYCMFKRDKNGKIIEVKV